MISVIVLADCHPVPVCHRGGRTGAELLHLGQALLRSCEYCIRTCIDTCSSCMYMYIDRTFISTEEVGNNSVKYFDEIIYFIHLDNYIVSPRGISVNVK